MPQKSVTNWDQKLANWDLTLLGETINFGVVKHGETWCDMVKPHEKTVMMHGFIKLATLASTKVLGRMQKSAQGWASPVSSHISQPPIQPQAIHFGCGESKLCPKIFIDMYRSSPKLWKKCVLDNFFLQQISDFPPFFPPVFRNGRVFFYPLAI